MRDRAQLFIAISPEPTDDERDAIEAVMLMHHAAREQSIQDAVNDRPSRWALAGRREALRGLRKAPFSKKTRIRR